MRVFSGFCASLGLVMACSGGTNTSANGGTGATGNGTSGSGTSGGSAGNSTSGDAGASGSGTAASAGTLNGTAGSASGAGGSGANAGSAGVTFCVVGAKGCPCDSSGACAANLVCTVSTCCDATGDCSVPPGSGAGGGNGSGGSGGSSTGAGGSAGASACTPGVTGPVITDCGYPYASNNPLTSVTFIENEVLRAILPSGGSPLASVRLFYNDEHALTLGVRSVVAGGTTTDYDVTPLVNNPDVSHYPHTGTNALTGDQSGLDPSGRPMWPALFVTDITNDPNSRAGDWQEGGTPWNPNAIFGTWKPAVRTVAAMGVSITPDADPTKNNWLLGAGSDPVPAGLKSEGWGAEVRWDLVLAAGHQYRIQVLVHDGDQNKSGGDVGEACVDFCAADSCPDGSIPCTGKSDCDSISADAQCVNGCCI